MYNTLGNSITSGDFNGDGFSDIACTAESCRGIDTTFFLAYVFLGGVPFDTIADFRIAHADDTTGFILAQGIDINGDGYDDLALGNQHWSRVLIYLGGSPMDTVCDYVLREPIPENSMFGYSLAKGDVNGDGYDDLIVGAYGADVCRGAVWIYYGGPQFDTFPDVWLKGGHNGDVEEFGTCVGSGGDLNDDGHEDIVVGAGTAGPGCQGRIYIYFGGSPMDTSYDMAMLGPNGGSDLGWSGVAILRNDSCPDYAVAGARGAYLPSGRVYVWFGGTGMDSVPDLEMAGAPLDTYLGFSTACAGRIDGGTCDGLISGAPGGRSRGGAVYVWLLGASPDTTPDAWIWGDYGSEIRWLGLVQTGVGDVDGDGRDEIAVSNYPCPGVVWVCEYSSLPGVSAPGVSGKKSRLSVTPNPCRTRASITFDFGLLQNLQVTVRDVTGRRIRMIDCPASPSEPATCTACWDLRDDNGKLVPCGVYFIEIAGQSTNRVLGERARLVVMR